MVPEVADEVSSVIDEACAHAVDRDIIVHLMVDSMSQAARSKQRCNPKRYGCVPIVPNAHRLSACISNHLPAKRLLLV